MTEELLREAWENGLRVVATHRVACKNPNARWARQNRGTAIALLAQTVAKIDAHLVLARKETPE